MQELLTPPQPPLVRICDLRPDEIRCVEGAIHPATHPIPTPHAGVAAVTITIRQRSFEDRTQAENSGGWTLVNDLDFGTTFFVSDATGTVRIRRGSWSKLEGLRDRVGSGESAERSARLADFRAAVRGSMSLQLLEKYDLTGVSKTVQREETYIEVGARVRVSGVVRGTGERAPQSTFREARPLYEMVGGDMKAIEQLIITRLAGPDDP